MKPDKTVLKETGILLIGTALLCGVMCGIFALFGKFDYTVLTGAALGGLASVCNFFLLGITVQRAVGKDEADAKKLIQLSHTVRMFALVAVLGVGVYFGSRHQYFHWLAVLLSALFPRVTIFFRSFALKKKETDHGGETS